MLGVCFSTENFGIRVRDCGKTKNCSLCDNTASSPPEELKCGPKECRFNQETCAWEKISQCKKTIGYLHDANFTNGIPTMGENTTTSELYTRNYSNI